MLEISQTNYTVIRISFLQLLSNSAIFVIAFLPFKKFE